MDFKSLIPKICVLLLLAVFVFSVVTVIASKKNLSTMENENKEIAEQYTEIVSGNENTDDLNEDIIPKEVTPIKVDFAALREANSDVVGWIYCEDTPINYPVMQTDDNSYYLKHTFENTYSDAGSIFVDSRNREEFIDGNTIIYGHHMPDGTMFTALEKWNSQDFYEKHKSLYLLTPNGDYRIDIVAGYFTSSRSKTYKIIYDTGEQVSNYLDSIKGESAFVSDVPFDQNGHYVLLSTCSHAFENARYVLHGLLVELDSAGGEPKL